MKLRFKISFFLYYFFSISHVYSTPVVNFFSHDTYAQKHHLLLPTWITGNDFFYLCLQQSLKKVDTNVSNTHKEKDFLVRVLLQEKNKNEAFTWHLSNPAGFVLSDMKSGKRFRHEKDSIAIECSCASLHINNKKIIAPLLKIDPLKNILSFDGKEYQGSFLIVQENEKCYLINMLQLEDYVYSVLRSESWPGWPLEVNKAFAIACRSYLAAKVLESKRNKEWYHIKNTNLHQTYQGYHKSPILKQAVEETQGIILGYKKKPILAMFDSCCGSIIPAHIEGIDFKQKPYLAREQACTFCKPCKIYSWKIEYSLDEIQKILSESGKEINGLQEITIVKKDTAGIVQKIGITTDKEQHFFTGKEFYSLISKIKSYCYDIEKMGKKIIIKGKGYGHHLGICQWGARNMVASGWDFQKILKFYYPSSVFMKLKTII